MSAVMDQLVRELAVMGARHAILELEKTKLEIVIQFPELEGDVEIGMGNITMKAAQAAHARLSAQLDRSGAGLIRKAAPNGHAKPKKTKLRKTAKAKKKKGKGKPAKVFLGALRDMEVAIAKMPAGQVVRPKEIAKELKMPPKAANNALRRLAEAGVMKKGGWGKFIVKEKPE